MRRLNLILLAIAAIALAVMLKRVDWPSLALSFSRGWRYLPVLLIPYGVTSLCWTVSWRLLLIDTYRGSSLGRLFFVRLGGESLNQLTPTASLGGEPFKASCLYSCGVAWQDATVSLLVHKALMVLSLVCYIFLGIALIPVAMPSLSPRLALSCCLGALLLATAGASFVVVQRRSPCTSLIRTLRRWGMCPAFLGSREAELATLDSALRNFYREHGGAGCLALLVFLVGWLFQAAEVYLIFSLLGHPIGFGTALCLDALSQLIAGLGFMVPASIGVQDGGNIMLSLGFNMGPTLGAGFSILRRFREAFWLLLGLVVVACEKKGTRLKEDSKAGAAGKGGG